MMAAVLGSGSRGNAFALSADGYTLMVDAGFSLRALRRRAARAGVDFSLLAGVVLTHEHSDHAGGAARLAAAARCPLYATHGTLRAVPPGESVATHTLAHLETVHAGPFEITACRVVHDAVEPVAVAVTGPDGERIVLAYDFGTATSPLKYLLRTADCIVLESNHDERMLAAGPYPPSVQRRIGGSHGHISNRVAADLLADACHSRLETVVLAHVSELCNRKSLARETAAEALERRRFAGALLVAEQDVPLEAFPVGG